MKKKRFFNIVITILAVIIAIILIVLGLSNYLYTNHIKTDDEILVRNYKEKKENSELIKSIPSNFIEEGKGIKLDELPNRIIYEIKNENDGTIEFFYYIEPVTRSDYNSYQARIILTENYEIIFEKYGDMELEDFETFKNNQKKFDMFLAVLEAVFIVSIGIVAILIILCVIITKLDKDSEEKKS